MSCCDVTCFRLSASFFLLAYLTPLSIIATMYLLILRFLRQRRRQSTLSDRPLTASTRRAAFVSLNRTRSSGGGARRGTTCSSISTMSDAAPASLPVCSTFLSVQSARRRTSRTSYTSRVFTAIIVVFAVCWLPLHTHLLLVMFIRQPDSRYVCLYVCLLVHSTQTIITLGATTLSYGI